MLIYIPTRGRVGKQITLRSIPEAFRDRVRIVCPRDEVKEHKKEHPHVIAQPARIQNIAEKREWIMKNAESEKIMMIDDDCSFYARGPKGLLKEYATDERLIDTFEWVEDELECHAHVGLSSRMGNNRVEDEMCLNTRMMHALAYNLPTVVPLLKFKRVLMREDFDFTLQLLRKGYANLVRFDVCVAPGSYGAKGGCADERTVAKSDEEARKLAALHPGLVKVVQKDYKGVPRLEVVVQWKRSYRHDC